MLSDLINIPGPNGEDPISTHGDEYTKTTSVGAFKHSSA